MQTGFFPWFFRLFKKMRCQESLTIVVLGFCFWVPVARTAGIEAWEFYTTTNSSAEIIRSVDAQDGERLVRLNTAELEFLDDDDLSYGLYRPKAYLLQTVAAAELRQTHFHISGFARSLTPDFSRLIHLHDEHLEERVRADFAAKTVGLSDAKRASLRAEMNERMPDMLGYRRESFIELIKGSHASANFGVWVFLHMAEDKSKGSELMEGELTERQIRKFTPTSAGSIAQSERWNRFNVEVSVPKKCVAVSVVLWSEGLNVVEFDHIAVVANGVALKQSSAAYLSRFDGLYERFEQHPLIIQSEFTNLGFEN